MLHRVKLRELRGIVALIDANRTLARFNIIEFPENLKTEFVATLPVHADAVAVRRARV